MLVSARALTPAGRPLMQQPPVVRKVQTRLDNAGIVAPKHVAQHVHPNLRQSGLQSLAPTDAVLRRPSPPRPPPMRVRPLSQAGLKAAVPLTLQPFSEERLRELIPSPQAPKNGRPFEGRSFPTLGWGAGVSSAVVATAATAKASTSSILHPSASGPLPHKQEAALKSIALGRPTEVLVREPGGALPKIGRAHSATARTPSSTAARLAEIASLQINLTGSASTSTPPARPRGSGRLGGKPVFPHTGTHGEEHGSDGMRPPRRVSFVPPPCPSPEVHPPHAGGMSAFGHLHGHGHGGG